MGKKYYVYTYKRTNYRYKDIRQYKYLVGTLASIIATMVTSGCIFLCQHFWQVFYMMKFGLNH